MRVLLIDDHPLILAALQAVIEGLGDAVQVSGVGSARAACEQLQRDDGFDLVLLDLALGDADGFDLLAHLREAHPALPVVVVSASDRTSDVIRAIDMGAMGFVPKRSSNEVLSEALRSVMSGGIYVPAMEMGGGDAQPPAELQRLAEGTHPPGPDLESIGLTPRQRDVMQLLLKGQPNKLIARELKLSVETVKDHVAAVLRALGVNSRTQAVLAVSQMMRRRPALPAEAGATPAEAPPMPHASS
jgi:DNA-binding NarL/FixJ family response regulator